MIKLLSVHDTDKKHAEILVRRSGSCDCSIPCERCFIHRKAISENTPHFDCTKKFAYNSAVQFLEKEKAIGAPNINLIW